MKIVKNAIVNRHISGLSKLGLQMKQKQNSLDVSSARILGENIGNILENIDKKI